MKMEWAKATSQLTALGVAITLSSPCTAEDGIEIRAASVCAGIGKMKVDSQGATKIDNFDVQATANGTVVISRDGVDLGKIEKGSYDQYTSCLTTVIKILSAPKSQ